MDPVEVLDRILAEKIIAVVRLATDERLDEIVDAIVEGGIGIIEITLTTPGALDAIQRLSGREDLLVGAGTVVDEHRIPAVVSAGGRFVASPVYHPAWLAAAHNAWLLAIPGAFSPTEIHTAWRDGARLIKLFPAPENTAAFIRTLRGPLPDLRIAPSGGVTAANAGTLLAAGAAALNVGTWLTHELDGTPSSAAAIRSRAHMLRSVVDASQSIDVT